MTAHTSERTSQRANTLLSVAKFDDLTLSSVQGDKLADPEGAHILQPLQVPNPVSWSTESGKLLARFRLVVSLRGGGVFTTRELYRLKVAVIAHYTLKEPLTDEQRGHVPDFLALRGWTQAWPYLRSEIQELSVKLGLPPLVLPLLQPGGAKDIDVKEVV